MAKKMTIGDVREHLTREMFNDLDKIISENILKTDIYYILQFAQFRGDVLMKKYMLISQEMLNELKLAQPHKFIGTTCHRVDNKLGKIDCLWILPLDFPIEHVDSALCAGSQFILDSATSIAPAINTL